MTPITRRVFLALGAVAARAQSPALDPNTLQKFVDPLPIPAVAKLHRLEMSEVWVKVHRDLPPTRRWGYNGISPGPVIEARSGQSIKIEWANNLPGQDFLPIDHNLHGAEKISRRFARWCTAWRQDTRWQRRLPRRLVRAG